MRASRKTPWYPMAGSLSLALLALLLLVLAGRSYAHGTVIVDLGNDITLQEDSSNTFTPWVSYTGGSSTLAYTWDFGDGTVSHADRPSHTYTKSGTYTVSLTVTDTDGTTGSDSLTAKVLNVRPIADAGASRTITKGTTVTFDGSNSWDTPSDLPLLTYEWDFGDGTAGTGISAENKIVTHTYSQRGVYIVRLVVRDDDWTASDSASFRSDLVTVSGAADGNGTVRFFHEVGNGSSASGTTGVFKTSYYWDFGDGSSANGNSASHTYSDDGVYIVTLVITDNLGAMDVVTLMVTVLNAPPVAEAGPSLNAVEDAQVAFLGTATYSGDGPLTFEWDFGDGYASTDLTPNHAYQQSGVYTAKLTVTDQDGGTGTDTTTVTVLNVAPTAAFSVDHTTYEGDVISFDASTTTDTPSDVPLLTYSWGFGDGSTASGLKVTHAYADDGAYTVTLTVKDDDGITSTATLAFNILNAAPTATITSVSGPSSPILTGDTVTCKGSATDPGTKDVLSYSWAFGDGSSGTGSTATHKYTTTGTYTVKLSVSDGDGGTGTATASITVKSPSTVATTARDDVSNAPASAFAGKHDQKNLVKDFNNLISDLNAGSNKNALTDVNALLTDVNKKVTDATLKANLLAALNHIKSALGG